MAVVTITHITVKPGRTFDHLEWMKRSKPILERHGVRSVRLLYPVASGALSETALMLAEVDDLAALGTVNQALFGDPEMVDIIVSCTAPDGPTQSFSNSVYMDAPLD
jgi:hypothetical protein